MTHSGDPLDQNLRLFTVPIDNGCFATTPTTGYKNGTVVTCPLNLGKTLEILEVCISAYTSAIDATDPVTIVLKTVTAAGVAKATLNTAVSIKSTGMADKASVEVFNGRAILLPGESLEYEVTVTTPDTAGFGYTISGQAEEKAQ